MIIGNNAECRNLSCCTRSRRNRAEFCFVRSVGKLNGVIRSSNPVSGYIRMPTHRFRCINWRTTADRYDPVRTKFLHKLCALHNGLNARICLLPQTEPLPCQLLSDNLLLSEGNRSVSWNHRQRQRSPFCLSDFSVPLKILLHDRDPR